MLLAYCLTPRIYPFTVPIEWLQHSVLRWVGVGLLLLSLFWIILAQRQMGESWRIGINRDHAPMLVKKGVFKISRNPIFLGMITTLLGLLSVLPNGLTLLSFVVGVVLISIQVRLEEEYLLTRHVDEYAEYRRRVRRWI
jgi:protein-S-isoprenylcysteine O-methyltransferase Ste14